MGTSTNAILCYGFCLEDENGESEDFTPSFLVDGEDSVDFEEFLLKLAGLQAPYESFNAERFGSDPDYKKKWSDYFAKKREVKGRFGVDLVYHCSGEYPMYILAVSDSVKCARKGNPIELGQSVTKQEEWANLLRGFCERANIEFKEPQFILCSYWI